MQTKQKHTIVVMPDNKKLDVSYYCSNGIAKNGNQSMVNLVIQLDDCHSSIKIPKTKVKDQNELESIVQKTVINARGHLCD